ncbi:hypothetical protein [Chryseobacterium viscerum]|uniref:Uncharacterized protein n=1 Tax=Chryseobacterium viscerum TaxID=1037377 RepID=A0A316WDJ6_9FLAO|nr:hypothetical protein [Chryseobacterium viscerum]PWN58393.1 hypothetical protein C1634_022840 [Chryseobacterium viscerum]
MNNRVVGETDYGGEIFIIKGIDTPTDKYFLYHLKNNVLTLKNDVGYCEDNKLIKSFPIELIFLKTNNN